VGNWNIIIKVGKQVAKLPTDIRCAFLALVTEMELSGPILPRWSHFGKIKGSKSTYHCHLKDGRPTYVVCWRQLAENKIEVYYVGTHENAPY
jgi:hypothetical protein